MMNKLVFGLVVFALLSCEKTVYSPDPEKDIYALKSITYVMGEGDGVETFVKPFQSLTYVNGSSVTQKIVVDPIADVMESSQFFSADENAFSWVEPGETSLAVPIRFEEGTAVLGESKWLYTRDLMQQLPTINLRDTLEIPAHTTLTVTLSVYLYQYNVSYKATFEGKPSGTLQEVNGKWKGVVVGNVDKQIQYQ